MKKKHKNDIVAIILIFWSIMNLLMFFWVYIGSHNFAISGYKLMFTFNLNSFITILAMIQFIFTLIILGMLVLGILFLLEKNSIKQNYPLIYSANLFRVLPFLVISLNIIFIATMFIGIKIIASRYDIFLFNWFIGPGVYLNFIINFIISIILIIFSKKQSKSNVQF